MVGSNSASSIYASVGHGNEHNSSRPRATTSVAEAEYDEVDWDHWADELDKELSSDGTESNMHPSPATAERDSPVIDIVGPIDHRCQYQNHCPCSPAIIPGSGVR
jgi:hypothetical protein